MVRDNLGFKARGIELNVLQRCASHFTSLVDINEAFEVGAAGVAEAVAGGTGKMMAYERVSNKPYKMQIVSRDIKNIANGERVVPQEWISNGNDVTQEMIDYVQPLIEGTPTLKYENGLPVYLKR